jgi:hypothetical protein
LAVHAAEERASYEDDAEIFVIRAQTAENIGYVHAVRPRYFVSRRFERRRETERPRQFQYLTAAFRVAWGYHEQRFREFAEDRPVGFQYMLVLAAMRHRGHP